MTAYYNEHNPEAAGCLRSLISDGAIAPGRVDERDVRDVTPADLQGFDQVHLFAGIGIWSLALRQAGWSDGRKIWTASCPCQPFSAAGGKRGFADERHLWPAAHHLIEQCRPDVVVGEQVQSQDGLAWFDLVRDDLEGTGFTVGAINIPAASVGAPHLRQRLYWMGHSALCRVRALDRVAGEGISEEVEFGRSGLSLGLADSGGEHGGTQTARSEARTSSGLGDCGEDGELAGKESGRRRSGTGDRGGPTNGFWRDADWLRCRDGYGSWRPVEPGSCAVAHGLPRAMDSIPPELRRLAEMAGLDQQSLAGAKKFRTRSLKGYGNAIVAPLAAAFIGSIMDILVPMMVGLISLAFVAAAASMSP